MRIDLALLRLTTAATPPRLTSRPGWPNVPVGVSPDALPPGRPAMPPDPRPPEPRPPGPKPPGAVPPGAVPPDPVAPDPVPGGLYPVPGPAAPPPGCGPRDPAGPVWMPNPGIDCNSAGERTLKSRPVIGSLYLLAEELLLNQHVDARRERVGIATLIERNRVRILARAKDELSFLLALDHRAPRGNGHGPEDRHRGQRDEQGGHRVPALAARLWRCAGRTGRSPAGPFDGRYVLTL